MSRGDSFRDPILRYRDSHSGREIVRLTHHLGHSNHLYFTEPCWCSNGRSFIFTSDRNNQSNLYRYDLDTFTITQLTELTSGERPSGCFSAANNRHYYFRGRTLYELDVFACTEREVWSARGDVIPLLTKSRPNPTADGKYVCALLMQYEDTSSSTITFAYSRFREFFETKPLTRIIKIDVASGAETILLEDRRYLGHVNTSPTLPHILTFCHEGPWRKIAQRIWGMDITTGRAWKIRPQETDGPAVGHEYWFADGQRVGYHGFDREGAGGHFFGHIRFDNTGQVEAHFPFSSTHFHSLDETLVVGDGTPVFAHEARPYIQLFKWVGDRYTGPRILAFHRSTFNDQHAHPHPRFTPDGKHVIYTSDLSGYSNIFMVAVDDYDTLPLLT